MRRVCHSAITVLSVLPGDTVFAEWETPEKPQMFFIQNGQLEYTAFNRSYTVDNQEFLAEPCLWTAEWRHVGTLRALTTCRLLSVDAAKFQSTVCNSMSEYVIKYANGFVNLLNQHKADRTPLTDLGRHVPDLHRLAMSIFSQPLSSPRPSFL